MAIVLGSRNIRRALAIFALSFLTCGCKAIPDVALEENIDKTKNPASSLPQPTSLDQANQKTQNQPETSPSPSPSPAKPPVAASPAKPAPVPAAPVIPPMPPPVPAPVPPPVNPPPATPTAPPPAAPTPTAPVNAPIDPSWPDPAKDLLIVYNSKSKDSVDLLNYYRTQRAAGIEKAPTFAIAFPTWCEVGSDGCYSPDSELVPGWPVDYAQIEVVKPILDHLKTRPTIKHVLLLYGIPTRSVNFSESISSRISGPSNTKVTTINMGSAESTKAYIDKLVRMKNSMPQTMGPIISSKSSPLRGVVYGFEDAGSRYGGIPWNGQQGELRRDAVLSVNPSAIIDFRPFGAQRISTLKDVAGFVTWGANGGREPTYSGDGSIKFSGNSSWWVLNTIESFNGQQRVAWQGSYERWFAKNAFGSVNYENTPVAATAHTTEPSLLGVADASLYACWESGKLWIDCAASATRTPSYLNLGDPYISR